MLALAFRFVRLALKALCYLALAFLGSGIAILVFVAQMGGCPRLDEGAVQCISPFYYSLGTFGYGVVMVSVFFGLPALLAFAGAVWLLVDLRRWWRRRRSPS